MKTKKTKKADLKNYSTTFMLIGLLMVLIMSFKTINLKTVSQEIDTGKLDFQATQDDKTLVVKIEQEKIKPIPKKKIATKIDLVEDDEKIKEDLFAKTDFEESDSIPEIESISTDLVEETDIPVPIAFVEQAPVFPGCEGKEGDALKKCLSNKISKFVSSEFNTGIAEDLGLSGERVKIITQFTIDKTGKITQIKTRSKYKDLEAEARRIIKLFPRMKPAIQNLRKVSVTYALPIMFRVDEE